MFAARVSNANGTILAFPSYFTFALIRASASTINAAMATDWLRARVQKATVV